MTSPGATTNIHWPGVPRRAHRGEALAACGAFLVLQVVGSGRGVDVVRALSGRGTLAPEFNLY